LFLVRILAYWNWIWVHTTIIAVINQCIFIPPI
jgi:hypothetical protein